MIYVLEVPHEGQPHAWFAFNVDDLYRKLQVAREGSGRVLFETTTARQQWVAEGMPIDASRLTHPQHHWLFDLIDRYGWDTTFYRADFLLGDETYTTQEISPLEACVAAAADGLKACRIFLSDQLAIEALNSDPLFDEGRLGAYAYQALRSQLTAMDAMPDNV